MFVSTHGTDLTLRERTFLAFLAPRGIVAASVASVFALKLSSLSQQSAAQAAALVPVTFFVILGTVSIYGLLAGPLARRLSLADPDFASIHKYKIAAIRQTFAFPVK